LKFKALGAGVLILALFSPANAETLCVEGAAYIEDGRIIPPTKVVARNVKECPEGTDGYIQRDEKAGSVKTVLTSTEIKRLRRLADERNGK
jgi:hypothetical protein